MLGTIIFVEYGRCGGLPVLTGRGRIDDLRTHKGVQYVYVTPIEGMPLPKWIPFSQTQYDFASNVPAETAEAIPA